MYEMLLQALQLLGLPLAEGEWDRAPQSGSYLTVALHGETSSQWADDRQRQQAIGGSVHLFARNGEKCQMQSVQDVLSSLGISWELASIQHEAKAHLVHYEWTFDLEGLSCDL